MSSEITIGQQRRLARLAAGRTISEEARRCGVSHTAIQHREQAGVMRRVVGAGVQMRFRRLWQAGKSIREMAQIFNRSYSWVSLTAKRLGLPGRKRGRRRS